MTGQGSNPPDEMPAPAIAQGSVQVLPGRRRIRNAADIVNGGDLLNDAYMRLGILIANFAHIEATLQYVHWNLYVADLRLADNAGTAGPGASLKDIEFLLAPYRRSDDWTTKYIAPALRIDRIAQALTSDKVSVVLAAIAYDQVARDRWRELSERGKILAKRRNNLAHNNVALAFLATGPVATRLKNLFGPSEQIDAQAEDDLGREFGAYAQDLTKFSSDICDRLPTDERYRIY
ncbi:MAG: hypothetical protein IBJ15_02115 [Alphaproteobacteria bacterium]|nr:hypothetical protein [Alphaproteobacteria bacterium]